MGADFINDDFLLNGDAARRLYHEHADQMPIIDYHCHLDPSEIAGDRRWDNIAQVWLGGDHYKWRALRSNGIDEDLITGDAPDREKFNAWAETMPRLLRNPLYHWTHLELARYFDVKELFSPSTADDIWDRCNAKLAEDDFSARGLISRSNVKVICTTDDPLDNLEHHKALASERNISSPRGGEDQGEGGISNFTAEVLPTWRPDKGMQCENMTALNGWIDQLAEITNIEIGGFDSYLEAIKKRHDYFHEAGCRLSDHGLETFYADAWSETEIHVIFDDIRTGKELSAEDISRFKAAMMYHFAAMDSEKDWAQQIHYGVIRNNNSRMLKRLGADAGFDSIGSFDSAKAMSRFFDRLDSDGCLPRTVIYNINPSDNEIVATMLGNFQDGSAAGKMQMGSGWWFLDQKDGMERQIEALSQLGLLSRFVGMLTDSRSFLSYTRHEYFRRILCNILGSDMEQGLVPMDYDLVGSMVEDICYTNAEKYFGFGE